MMSRTTSSKSGFSDATGEEFVASVEPVEDAKVDPRSGTNGAFGQGEPGQCELPGVTDAAGVGILALLPAPCGRANASGDD